MAISMASSRPCFGAKRRKSKLLVHFTPSISARINSGHVAGQRSFVFPDNVNVYLKGFARTDVHVFKDHRCTRKNLLGVWISLLKLAINRVAWRAAPVTKKGDNEQTTSQPTKLTSSNTAGANLVDQQIAAIAASKDPQVALGFELVERMRRLGKHHAHRLWHRGGMTGWSHFSSRRVHFDRGHLIRSLAGRENEISLGTEGNISNDPNPGRNSL